MRVTVGGAEVATSPAASTVSVVWFLTLVLLVSALFIWALARPAPRERSRRLSSGWSTLGTALVLAYLIGSAQLASRGFLADFSSRPPTMALFLVGFTTTTTVLAFSRVGNRLLATTGVAGLLGFQAFRVPLELLLHRLHNEGLVPAQMTYAGYNFDIVSGLVCGVAGLWGLRAVPPRWVIVGANAVGMLLLLNILTIAVLSLPTPLQRFPTPNTFVTRLPFVWLPAILVQAAWVGHLLMFRKLSRER
jgi:hypothetical protein